MVGNQKGEVTSIRVAVADIIVESRSNLDLRRSDVDALIRKHLNVDPDDSVNRLWFGVTDEMVELATRVLYEYDPLWVEHGDVSYPVPWEAFKLITAAYDVATRDARAALQAASGLERIERARRAPQGKETNE